MIASFFGRHRRNHQLRQTLLCLLSAALLAQVAHARDPYRDLRAALTFSQAVQSDQELLGILELAADVAKRQSPFEMKSVAPSSTRGGGSLIFLPDGKLADQPLIAWLAPQVALRISEPLRRPAPCRGVDCCQRMADLTCVQHYPVERSFFGGFDVLIVVFDSLAMELAQKSVVLSTRDLRAGRLGGDTAWWVWPVRPERDAYLLTEIDPELMDRLAGAGSVLKKVVARTCGGGLEPSTTVACTGRGFRAGRCPGSPRATVTTSTGSASRARSSSPLGSTVEADVYDSCLQLRWKDAIGRHRGIRDWNQKAGTFLTKGGGACLGEEVASALEIEQRALGRPDAGILFFYSLYLLGLWDEVAGAGIDPFSCGG